MSKSENLFVFGRHPVEEALLSRPDEVDKIFVKSNLKVSSYQKIKELASENGIPISKVPGQKIFNLVGRVNDQGFVAQLSAVKYTDFFEWVQELYLSENPAVLLLQGIEDPHNFGAILRSAAAAGISAVIVPTQNQAPVNATVFKTSAGTAGRIPIIRIHDINQGIKDLSATGFSLIGLEGKADQSIWDVELNKPVAFLIGNEGAGLSKENIRKCDTLVKLPLENNVESLNASVTAALVSYEWKRRRS